MRPRSNSLFHFTRSLESLKSILRTGLWPRYCLEDVRWQTPSSDISISIAVPMVCFCDIPLTRITEHIEFYGAYGIGFSREWAIINGANPVLYLPKHNHLAQAIMSLATAIRTIDDEQTRLEAIESLRLVAMHSRPTSGTMLLSGKLINKDFYQESEWRYIPQTGAVSRFLFAEEFHDMARLAHENAATRENCMLRFEPADIRYIFVKTENDIPEVVDFVQSQLDHPDDERKVLLTRITSLDSVRTDW